MPLGTLSQGAEDVYTARELRDLLVADATLITLMGGGSISGRVWENNAPVGAAFPLITYSSQGAGADVATVNRGLMLANPLITVKAIGRGGAGPLFAIVKRIHQLITGWQYTDADGYVYAAFRTAIVNYEEVAGSDRFQHRGATYQFQVQTF